jgi:hypothetical protein
MPITKTEAPQGGGILGGVIAVSDLTGLAIDVAPFGNRSIASGTTQQNNWSVPKEYDTLVGTFNPLTGIWTCPSTGYYDITTLFSLSADVSPFNNVVSGANPSGFISDSLNSQNTDVVPIVNFNDYFGIFRIGVTTISGSQVVCSNTEFLYFETSQVVLSASYTNRYITAGTQLVCKYLNKGKNNMIGQVGNSFHFTATHLKNE